MTQLKQEITLVSGIRAALYDLVRYWALYDSRYRSRHLCWTAVATGLVNPVYRYLSYRSNLCCVGEKRYPNAGGTAYFVRQAFSERLETEALLGCLLLFLSAFPLRLHWQAALLNSCYGCHSTHLWSCSVATVALLIAVNPDGQ